jgi:hypothetical protein
MIKDKRNSGKKGLKFVAPVVGEPQPKKRSDPPPPKTGG